MSRWTNGGTAGGRGICHNRLLCLHDICLQTFLQHGIHTHAHTCTHAHQQEGVSELAPCGTMPAPPPRGGSEAPLASDKARPHWNPEASSHGKQNQSLPPLGPACCCQNPVKSKVSSGNPASFLQGCNKSSPRSGGLYTRPVQTCQVVHGWGKGHDACATARPLQPLPPP